MPLVSYNRNYIELEISDRVTGDTVIKQKARCVQFKYNQFEDSHATITVRVTMYASVNGEYGDALPSSAFPQTIVKLEADNNCLVNGDTGAIIAIRNGETDAMWLANAELHPEPVMFQGDFFEKMRDSNPVLIADLIKYHIMQADAAGKFTK